MTRANSTLLSPRAGARGPDGRKAREMGQMSRSTRPSGPLAPARGDSSSESAGHVLPLHDLVVDLAQAAADHAAKEIEELQRRVGIHRQDLVERGAIDGENGGVAFMRFGVSGASLVVDQRHLAEEVATIENGQGLLAHARNEFRDPDAAIEDDEELVALLA